MKQPRIDYGFYLNDEPFWDVFNAPHKCEIGTRIIIDAGILYFVAVLKEFQYYMDENKYIGICDVEFQDESDEAMYWEKRKDQLYL
jgi:hypothetical protein